MIISHAKRFIFFAVPKTGTHAVRDILRLSKGEDDWEQQALFGQQWLPIPEIAEIQHGHISVPQIRPHLDQEIWTRYFKFAFVRNPFDRFISICFFLNRQNPSFRESPLAWMKMAMKRPQFRGRVLVTPQYWQLSDSNADLAVDFVGRYETLQQSIDEVCERLQLKRSTLKSKNASEHGHYRDYYDDELKEWVGHYYREDLAHFNYAF